MTDQRKRFADKYFETLNATQSAIFAGYSDHSAGQQAYQLLQEGEVQQYLQELRKKYETKSTITREKWLDEIRKIAFSDIRNLYSGDGELHSVSQIDDDTAGAIASIKSMEVSQNGLTIGTIKEVKLHDKLKALDQIGKHMGYFEKDNQQKKVDLTPVMKVTIVPPTEED